MFKYFSAGGELLKTYKDCYFIHFEYKNDNAQDFFSKIEQYIKAFDVFTNQLAQPFGMGIKINLEIQSLENGSLRLWLKDVLEKIDENDIRTYINTPKEALIDFIIFLRKKLLKALQENKHNEILQINNEAYKNSSIAQDLGYSIDEPLLLESISTLTKKALSFENPPSIYINDEIYTMKNTFNYDIKEVCEVKKQEIKGTFYIKKPDLQGDSQWELITDKSIKVKIVDEAFLSKLKNREILIGYGDRLEATLQTTAFIYNGKIKELNYTITHIKNILPQEKIDEPFKI